jgi:hypothetical protein
VRTAIGRALLLLLLAGPAAAQQPRVSAAGQVANGVDSSAVPGIAVVLHRIGRDSQGPLDSTRTDARGRFAFRFPPDTTALYILTARYHGIEYFSPPVATNPARPDTNLVLAVYDTSSAEPVHTEARHIVIAKPAEDGTRTVVELVIVDNPGDHTRIARDTSASTWHMRIPTEAIAFSAEDGDLSAGAIDRNMDSVLVLAPLAPGERQLSVQYLMPASVGVLRYPFDEGINGLSVLVEEPDAVIEGGALVPTDSVVVIQGRPFRQFNGVVDSGDVVTVRVPVRGQLGRIWLVGLVVLLGGVLVAGLVRAMRRKPVRRQAPGTEPTVDATVAQIAALDREMEALAADDPRRAALQDERATLKAGLASTLARMRDRT